MDYPLIYAQIDLDAVENNILALRKLTNQDVKFMAVVKADAYGHGAVRVAQRAVKTGASWLGVARFHEAEELRKAGINAPILIFGFTHPLLVEKIADLDLTPTVYSVEMAEDLSYQACQKGVKIKAHLKIDTGMGRVGMLPDSRRFPAKSRGNFTSSSQKIAFSNQKSIEEIKKIISLSNFELEGIYTHFAAADSSDKSYAEYQLKVFNLLLDELKKEKIEFNLCHAANSAAIIDLPYAHFDMVRAGIAMYGLYPSDEVDKTKVNLKPAMELRSVITSVKEVPKGFKISYGMTCETEKKTIIASVPVGYADGYSRLLSSTGSMLVKGVRAPIAGRVCMDQTLIDVGHITGVKQGDEVVIMGSQKNKTISADDIARLIGTINYEIVSSLTSRVYKIFI